MDKLKGSMEVLSSMQLTKDMAGLDAHSKTILRNKEILAISLHVDLEPQKTYRPGYPIEKRGMYYLARSLSSQLSLVTGRTDYGQLEKCYSIWICEDDIPKREQYSVSVYEVVNTRNTCSYRISREKYDLMTLVVIKLGDGVYNGEKGEEAYDLLRFLNAVMYPDNQDYMDVMTEYIDFSENEELKKEVVQMDGMGQRIFERGVQEGIQALILDNLEEKIPRERILIKLQRHFSITEEKAEEYYEKFAQKI